MLALLVFSIPRSLLQIAFLPLGLTHRPSPAALPTPARDHIEWASYGFVTPATERRFDKQTYFAVVVGDSTDECARAGFAGRGSSPGLASLATSEFNMKTKIPAQAGRLQRRFCLCADVFHFTITSSFSTRPRGRGNRGL